MGMHFLFEQKLVASLAGVRQADRLSRDRPCQVGWMTASLARGNRELKFSGPCEVPEAKSEKAQLHFYSPPSAVVKVFCVEDWTLGWREDLQLAIAQLDFVPQGGHGICSGFGRVQVLLAILAFRCQHSHTSQPCCSSPPPY